MFEHHIIVEICWEVHGPSVLEPGAVHDQGDLCVVWHHAQQDEMILLAIHCRSCKYFISENYIKAFILKGVNFNARLRCVLFLYLKVLLLSYL